MIADDIEFQNTNGKNKIGKLNSEGLGLFNKELSDNKKEDEWLVNNYFGLMEKMAKYALNKSM